jgi:predicted transcriptional regulator
VKNSEERRNITLALPDDLLRRARILAVERRTSLSGLLRTTLEELVEADQAANEARGRGLDRLREGFDLGTGGRRRWDRDELHQR